MNYSLAINKSISHVLKTRKENSINLKLKSLEVQNTPILAENGKLKFIMHVVKRVGIYQLYLTYFGIEVVEGKSILAYAHV